LGLLERTEESALGLLAGTEESPLGFPAETEASALGLLAETSISFGVVDKLKTQIWVCWQKLVTHGSAWVPYEVAFAVLRVFCYSRRLIVNRAFSSVSSASSVLRTT
jgi:hypothetical protein